MTKYSMAIIIIIFAIFANITEAREQGLSKADFAELEAEVKNMRNALDQQTRCLYAIKHRFISKEYESDAYAKFYKALVKNHKKLVKLTLKHEGGEASTLLDYVKSFDIIVGMFLQSSLTRAVEYNAQFDNEKTGKSPAEFQMFLWETNNCDAILLSMD